MKWLASLALLALVASVPSIAAAQETPVDRPTRLTDRDTEKHWYGWQSILVDVGSLGAGLAAHAATNDTTHRTSAGPIVFEMGYLFAAPVVHVAHDRWSAALGSFGMRAVLQVFGTLVGGAIKTCGTDEPCPVNGVAVGFGAGLIVASALDAALLGWETVETAPKKSSGFAIAPAVATIKGGTLWGLSGQF